MVLIRQIQVDTIVSLISIQQNWTTEKQAALEFSEGRTDKLSQLSMAEAVWAIQCLLIAVDRDNCLLGIYQIAIDIGVVRVYKASSPLYLENLEAFLMEYNYLKQPFRESSIDQIKMAKAYMLILQRYCKEYQIAKKDVLLHVKEAWGVMHGKTATDQLLLELNFTTEKLPDKTTKKKN